MTRYADPERCPDCGAAIEWGAQRCGTCGLPLTGPVAQDLFTTLTRADELLRVLRVGGVPEAAGPAQVPAAASGGGVAAVPEVVRAARMRLGAASVPKILLGLGAVCLLIAALVFLAVTWSVLGVAGRTTVLVGFTAAAGVLAGWMARRDLRAAAESLSLVALGLLTLDLFGADDAGWFGDLAPAPFLTLLGGVLTLAGAAAGVTARRTPVRTLLGAELVAAAGVLVMVAGVLESDRLPLSPGLVAGTVLAAAVAATSRWLALRPLALGSAIVAALAWCGLLATSVVRAMLHDNLRELWLDLEGWPLLVAGSLVAGAAVVRALPLEVRVLCTTLALLVAAFVAVVPALDEGADAATLALLGVLAAVAVAAWVCREPWSWAPAATVGLAAVWPLAVVAVLAGSAADRLVDAGALMWAAGPGFRLPAGPEAPSGWLLPLCTVALLGSGVAASRAVRFLDRLLAPLADLALGGAVPAAAGLAALALYPVPLWLVVGGLLAAAVASVGVGLVRSDRVATAAGAVFLGAGVVPALADEWLTAAVLLVGAGIGLALHLRAGAAAARVAGGVLLVAAATGSVWTWGSLLGVDRPWVGLVAVAAAGAVVLTMANRPGHDPVAVVGLEVGGLASAFCAAVGGTVAASYSSTWSWTAGYLTLTGALVCAHALLRPDRRPVGWLGGFLLAAATWVRLGDVGVETPEAYTLPSAVALLLVGLVNLRRDPARDTVTALSPGLGLALVPSLVWVLDDPVTLRSLLLGLACLGLLLVGIRLRWTAPVVFAATVGAVLVLRHATPYAEAVPRWLLIGTTGALLVGLGVTWERRLREARTALGYVRALR